MKNGSIIKIIQALYNKNGDVKSLLEENKDNGVLLEFVKFAKSKYYENDGFVWAGQIRSKSTKGSFHNNWDYIEPKLKFIFTKEHASQSDSKKLAAMDIANLLSKDNQRCLRFLLSGSFLKETPVELVENIWPDLKGMLKAEYNPLESLFVTVEEDTVDEMFKKTYNFKNKIEVEEQEPTGIYDWAKWMITSKHYVPLEKETSFYTIGVIKVLMTHRDIGSAIRDMIPTIAHMNAFQAHRFIWEFIKSLKMMLKPYFGKVVFKKKAEKEVSNYISQMYECGTKDSNLIIDKLPKEVYENIKFVINEVS